MSDAIPPQTNDELASIAGQFHQTGTFRSIQSLGNGNINDTYLVETAEHQAQRFVLQRINQLVFTKPHQVMDNICHMEDHVCSRLTQQKRAHRWEIPRVLRTQTGDHHAQDEQGNIWRAIAFIESATTYDQIESPELAYEVGVGLGTFHQLIHDLPLAPMVDTLEGFHITPNYLKQYDQVCTLNQKPEGELSEFCQKFIRDRREWSHVLENAKAEGKLKVRPIHGDPKVNNVMIDTHTGKAVSFIDLDTVKPGLIHYDIGDCLRSGCNPLGEETQKFQEVSFDLNLCRNILKGYREAAQDFLSEQDYDYLYDCMRLLAFELGLRFYCDYVNQNQYFKADHPTHNLNRAVVQFKLAESIESQRKDIQKLINDLR